MTGTMRRKRVSLAQEISPRFPCHKSMDGKAQASGYKVVVRSVQLCGRQTGEAREQGAGKGRLKLAQQDEEPS